MLKKNGINKIKLITIITISIIFGLIFVFTTGLSAHAYCNTKDDDNSKKIITIKTLDDWASVPKGVDICGIIRCTVKNLKQSCINATYSGEYIFHIYRDKDDKEDNYFIDDRIFFIQSRDICINKIEMYDYNDNGSCKCEIIDTKLSPFLPCFTNKKCLQLTLDERNRKNIKKEDIDKTRTRERYII